MTISLAFTVSESGLKKSLRDMFAGAQSLIREAAQNAHRAGATRFDIQFTEESHTLVMANDGSVMTELDWRRFFSVGESGWNSTTRLEQNPFGIGCTSMLVCSRRMKIHSGYWAADIDSAAFFGGMGVDATEVREYYDGTRILLEIDDEHWGALGLDRLERVFHGFMLPVSVNGSEVDRHWAESATSLFTTPFEYGHLSIPASLDGLCSVYSGVFALFAQGFHVASPWPTQTKQPIKAAVHLDTSKVRPSVPDRTRLVDAPAGLLEACKLAYQSAVRYLVQQHADEHGWFNTMKNYPSFVAWVAPEALERDDAPVSQESIFTYSNDLHRLDESRDFDEEFVEWRGSHSEVVRACDMPAGMLLNDHDIELHPLIGNEVTWHNFARRTGLKIVDGESLHHGHSFYKKTFEARDMRNKEWIVEPVNPSETQAINHQWVAIPVVLHDGLTVIPPQITLQSGEVCQWDALKVSDEDYFAVNGTLYVGRQCNTFWGFISQLDDFPVDDRSDWYERDTDAEDESHAALCRIIRAVKGEGAADVLAGILRTQWQELKEISAYVKGKSFTVSFDSESGEMSVEEA